MSLTSTGAAPAGTRPAASGGEAFLVLPPDADVLALAAVWFAEAEWLRTPGAAPQAPVGARFRGVVDAAAAGELRLTWTTRLEGPLAVADLPDGVEPRLPPGARSVFRVVPEAEAAGPDPQVAAWLHVAARRAGGAVVRSVLAEGEGRTLSSVEVDAPEPGSAVGLTLYSPSPLAPEIVSGILRSVGSDVHLQTAGTGDEIAPYAVTVPTQYDGTITVEFSRAHQLPLSLVALDAHSYGPYAYRVRWTWVDSSPEGPDQQMVQIARRSVIPVLSRIVYAVQRTAHGAVVDEDGFVVPAEELARRTSAF